MLMEVKEDKIIHLLTRLDFDMAISDLLDMSKALDIEKYPNSAKKCMNNCRILQKIKTEMYKRYEPIFPLQAGK